MSFHIIISSFLSGLLGAMGFGGGSILIIYLTGFLLLPQKEAQGINLVFFIFISLTAVFSYKKKNLIDKKEALRFLPLSLAGLISGYALLSFVPSKALSKLFGAMLIILGIRELLKKK